MIELIKALVLGAVQGITEFLPVSSTGHLILAEHLLGVSQEAYGLTFDAALHLGTLVAVFWFFKKEWLLLYRSVPTLLQNKRTNGEYTVLLLVVGTVPAVILGLLLETIIETAFRSPMLVGLSLILFSFVLWYVEREGRKFKELEKLTLKDALLIGTAQSIALIPGVSRSGITMASGMWRGLKRESAARFAFLLSAPIVAGAGGKKFIDVMQLVTSNALTPFDFIFFLTGMMSAAVFGYLTIKYFLQYISKHSLMPFIIYRIGLGLIILLVAIF